MCPARSRCSEPWEIGGGVLIKSTLSELKKAVRDLCRTACSSQYHGETKFAAVRFGRFPSRKQARFRARVVALRIVHDTFPSLDVLRSGVPLRQCLNPGRVRSLTGRVCIKLLIRISEIWIDMSRFPLAAHESAGKR